MHDLTSHPPSPPVETPRDNGVPPRRERTLRPRACAIALLAVAATLNAGCTGSLLPSTASSNQAASPTAPEGVVPRLRPHLVATNRSFLNPSAGRDAQKKMEMGSKGGMPGMKGMKGMDAPRMPGMGGSPLPSDPPGNMGGMPAMPGTPGNGQPPAGAAMPTMDPAMPGMNGAPPSGRATPPNAPSPAPAADPTPASLNP